MEEKEEIVEKKFYQKIFNKFKLTFTKKEKKKKRRTWYLWFLAIFDMIDFSKDPNEIRQEENNKGKETSPSNNEAPSLTQEEKSQEKTPFQPTITLEKENTDEKIIAKIEDNLKDLNNHFSEQKYKETKKLIQSISNNNDRIKYEIALEKIISNISPKKTEDKELDETLVTVKDILTEQETLLTENVILPSPTHHSKENSFVKEKVMTAVVNTHLLTNQIEESIQENKPKKEKQPLAEKGKEQIQENTVIIKEEENIIPLLLLKDKDTKDEIEKSVEYHKQLLEETQKSVNETKEIVIRKKRMIKSMKASIIFTLFSLLLVKHSSFSNLTKRILGVAIMLNFMRKLLNPEIQKDKIVFQQIKQEEMEQLKNSKDLKELINKNKEDIKTLKEDINAKIPEEMKNSNEFIELMNELKQIEKIINEELQKINTITKEKQKQLEY